MSNKLTGTELDPIPSKVSAFIAKYKYWLMTIVASLALYVFGGDFKKVVINSPDPVEETKSDSLTKDTIKL